jgi:hypothetical protein
MIDFLEHQTVFGAIVFLTQLSFAANPLFQVLVKQITNNELQ